MRGSMRSGLVAVLLVGGLVGAGPARGGADGGGLGERLARPELTEEEFTEIFADVLRRTVSGARIEVAGRLEVHAFVGEEETHVYLDNAWASCAEDPSRRAEVVAHYIHAFLAGASTETPADRPPERSKIVPMVKDQGYIDQSTKLAEDGGGRLLSEPLAADLWIAYAEDTPTHYAYLPADSLDGLGLTMEELRPLAVANLTRLLPPVRTVGSGPVYMLVTDGNTEANLLLIDAVWTAQQERVEGALVAAVPARDVCLFTGSETSGGVAALREAVAEVSAGGAYLVSTRLLQRVDGGWVEYAPAAPE